ncbi:MAG TPA: hypothetical protein VGC10_07255 [Sphingomonas sp.]
MKPEAGKRPRPWTRAKEIRFLEHLAASSNVAESERVAAVPVGCAYRYRRASPRFRAAWEQALADGYSMLELSMLERAKNGVAVTVTKSDGTRTESRVYSDQLATTLFKAHRETVARIRATAAGEGGRETLEQMLDEMARRAGDA